MTFMTLRRLTAWAATVMACTLGGCGALPSADPLMPAGSREWIITVENNSARPAVLVVAEDGPVMGDAVGTARPSSVPAGATQDVVFSVPPGEGWAVFVNPGPQRGPLILARDVPANVSGNLPLTIFVERNGSPGVSAPSEPGWFGN